MPVNQRASYFSALALAAPLAAAAGAQTVTFESIPDALSANDMSADGRFIVGETDLNGDFLADGTYLLDTLTGEMTVLPPIGLEASAVSDDGATVLGCIPDPEGVGSEVAGLWTAGTGWQSLGYLPDAGACPSRSNGYELSADGQVAVGLSWEGCSGRGFIWTEATGMLPLETLANGGNRASVVSADGTRIGGFAQGSSSRTPTTWDGTTAGELLDPPNGDALGEIYGLSDDGIILLGQWAVDEPAALATRWTFNGTGWERKTIGAGALLPGWAGAAMDIADDGTIVGFDFLIGNRRAWIQPGGVGSLVELRAYIESHGGTVPQGIALDVCQAITTDGGMIIGHGFGSGAWIVRIESPCPADLDNDGEVGIVDFLTVLGNWGTGGPGAAIAEPLDVVDILDFLALLGTWGPCSP